MRLAVGTKLGSYEITSPLGSGGMGEVYRARDAKLHRDVAVKILPDAVIEVPERLARFRREAQALASLNHPHIAAIYGLEEADGQPFLVLELVAGEDLAEKLKRGPIALDEALAFARQVAEALEAAHERGIIHRDLKPANIKVTPEGKVKLLDFGLAKAYSLETPRPDVSQSPTLSREATAAGVILGTAAYMSPEQARGKTLDKRTDVWAFGCVLFEMLTGRKPFEGETVTDLLAAIVKSEPDWSLLPGETPSRVRDVLQRCFRKAPDKRLRDVGEARLAIEATEDGDELSKAVPKRSFFPWWGTAAIAILGALAGGLAAWVLKGEGAKQVVRLATVLPLDENLVLSRSRIRVSPDGTKLAYWVGALPNRALAVRPLETLEPRIIEGSENGRGGLFSPDGDWIAFIVQGQLKKARIDGGASLTVADLSAAMSGIYFSGTWGDDGEIVFNGPSGTLLRVSAAGGTPEEATTLDRGRGEIAHWVPEILPGGKALLYLALVAPSKRQDLVVRSMETGETKVLLEGITGPARYVPTGYLLFAREDNLFSVPFDLRSLELRGEPFPVAQDLEVDVYGEYRTAQFDVSQDGTLVYLVDTPGIRTGSLVWVDRHGKATPVAEERNAYMVPRLSPDGGRIAFAVLDEGTGQRDVWVLDRNRGTRTRLTFGDGLSTDPVWSPDGRTIAFASTRSGRSFNLYSLAADGTGEATPLTNPEMTLSAFPRQWLPDGSGLLTQVGGAPSLDIGLLRVGGSFEEEILLGTRFEELEPSLSPDGKRLAYVSDESGRREVYVRDFPGPGRRWEISADGGDEPLWAPSGRELFYRNGNQMMVVPLSVEREPGTPVVLFEGEYERDPYAIDARNYDLSPDGTRFLMIRREVESDRRQQQLNVVLNWFEELKRLDPNR